MMWDWYYSLCRNFKTTDFLNALALLTKTNVGIEEALTILESKASPWSAWHIDQIRTNLQDAPDDYAGAFDAGLFSPDIHLRTLDHAPEQLAEHLLRTLADRAIVLPL